MSKIKLTVAIMDEWHKHDAGQGIPYIKWAEIAADVVSPVQNHDNASWNAGYRTAVGIHAGLVAAAEAVVYAFNDSHKPFEDRMLTLESCLNNLTTHLANNERELTRGGKS